MTRTTTIDAGTQVPEFERAVIMLDAQQLRDEPEPPVLARARLIREAFNCRLDLVCCVDEDAMTPALLDSFEDRLDDLQTVPGAVHGTVMSCTDSVAATLEVAADKQADLIVKQAEQDERFGFGFADRPDWRLLRSDAPSVWFVKHGPRPIEQVLVAVGNSDERALQEHRYVDDRSYRVFETAQRTARQLDSDLRAVHVVEGSGAALPAYDIAAEANVVAFRNGESAVATDDNARANLHGRQLNAFVSHFAPDAGDLEVRAGTAAEDVITDVTRETSADLLVIGAHKRSRWERVLSAPVAEPVLAEVQCDLLAVKSV